MLNSTLNPHPLLAEKETHCELPILTKTNANTLHKHLGDHFFTIRFRRLVNPVNPSPCDSQSCYTFPAAVAATTPPNGVIPFFLPRNILQGLYKLTPPARPSGLA